MWKGCAKLNQPLERWVSRSSGRQYLSSGKVWKPEQAADQSLDWSVSFAGKKNRLDTISHSAILNLESPIACVWAAAKIQPECVYMPQKNFSSKIGKSSSPMFTKVLKSGANCQQPLPVKSATKMAFNKCPVKK